VSFIEDDEIVREQIAALTVHLFLRAAEQHEKQGVIDYDHIRGKQAFARLLKETVTGLAAGLTRADVGLAANLRPDLWVGFDGEIAQGSVPGRARPVRDARQFCRFRGSEKLAGLLQSINTQDQKQLPWLADVPVLGALARSASYQKKETDLVIIVTPRLVRPARPGDVLRTPLDTSKPANDPEFFLLGQGEITVPMDRRIQGRSDGSAPPLGHILDIPQGERHVSK